MNFRSEGRGLCRARRRGDDLARGGSGGRWGGAVGGLLDSRQREDVAFLHQPIDRPEFPAAKVDRHFRGVGRSNGIERAGEPEVAVDHQPRGTAHQFRRTRRLLANHRRRQPDEAIVLARFQMVLTVPKLDAEEVRLYSREVAGPFECGETLGREVLNQRIRLARQRVFQVDHVHGAERPDRGLEGGNQIAAQLLPERIRQQRMRLGLHHDSPQARPRRLGIERRLCRSARSQDK